VGADRLPAFLSRYPEYTTTRHLDALRAAEYGRLDKAGHTYLDYTGASLFAESQIRRHVDLLTASVLGNPHSASPASSASTALVERARQAVLDWFGAGSDYTAIFTSNATGALKHVAESYPFAPGGRLLLTVDNHNSVNGIREYARVRGATVSYAPLTSPELRIDRPRLEALLKEADPGARNLFAFPAQSNFSGVKHPLDLVAAAQASGWHVLLDAAAFVPTDRLDLQAVQPDFVSVSFYKMFGYPTGVGCLLVRNAALATLHRPWFAGGTVNFATVGVRRHLLTPGEAGFEDGTLNYQSIAGVEVGLQHLASVGLDAVRTRVRCLTGWLLEELVGLRHSNGRPMVRIYGPLDTVMRGGIVTMNFYDPAGHLLDYRRVEELAAERRISFRTGCFCNPGAGETAEGITAEDITAALSERPDLTLQLFLRIVTARGGKSAGAIRVSFGLASNFADADRFLQFAETLRDQTRLGVGEATFDIEAGRVLRDGS
jgi:selenocysteine lyase/cysteine desulfurase